MVLKTEKYPSLNIFAAMYAAILTIFWPEFRCFGFIRQAVELKDSFEFCVCPPKHRVKSSSFESSS